MNATHHVAATVAAFFSLGSLAAQNVSISLSALTPLTVQMTSGTQSVQASLPPGPLPPSGDVTALAGSETASVSWFTHVDDTTAFVGLYNNILGSSIVLPASGLAGPHEFLVQFAATAPAPASLELSRGSQLSPGIPWPTVDIDLGNDGSIDIPNLGLSSTSTLSFGTQPFVLRVILASALPNNGTSATQVQLTLRPGNNLTVLQTATGCAPMSSGYGLAVAPTFVSSGVVLTLESTVDPMVLVLGLTQQPFLLPGSALAPCLVVPSLDVLLLPPPFSATTIPLPAAVRPATFQAQGVGISASGLLTTDAFSIFAY